MQHQCQLQSNVLRHVVTRQAFKVVDAALALSHELFLVGLWVINHHTLHCLPSSQRLVFVLVITTRVQCFASTHVHVAAYERAHVSI